MLTACLNICRLAFFVCAVLFNPAVQAATLTVTSSADAGAGSLRQTILEAAADDIIQFDEGMLITLTSGELLIDKKLTIDGVGHAVTVSGNNASRVFHVRAATVVLQNLTVTEGHADVGGGLLLEYSSGSPAATLTNVTFADNSASSNGGGLHNDYGSTATLTHVTFSGNSASYGGGLHNIGTAILANVTFSGNSASYGGGLHNHYGSTATLTHVTFSGNSASYGGGLYSTEQATLTNVTFSGNTASYGGGLLNLADIVTLTYVTFSGNTATSGGGIYSYSHIFLTNTLLAGNTGGNCSGPGEIHDFSKNLDDETSCNFGTYNGSLSNTVPLLGALGNYGGPTQTIPLLPGSPAIDAGAGTTGGCPATDQRGVTRPQGAACDIGAFESQGFTLAKTGGDLQSTAISTAFASALAVSVTAMVAGEPANGGQVTFTAPASGASATLSTNPVTIASGAASVTATANGTAGSYAVAASAKGAVTVSFGLTNQQTQTITFNNPGAQNFGTTPTLTATSDSQLPVTLSSSTTGVCTVNSAGVLTFVTAGTCTINADQAGNSDYWPATQVSRSFSVNAVPPGPPTGVTATAGDTAASVAFTAPGNTGGVGIVGYVVTASPADIVPVEGANSPLVVFGLTNGQSYTFTVAAVNSAGTGTPSAASNAVTPQAAQTITFTTTAPSATVGGPVYTPAAIASSGLPVSFALDPASSAVCTLTGAQVSFQAIGNCTINANQAGNNTFLAAPQVQQTVTVAKGAQTITFTSTAPSATVGGPVYTPTATATSGLPVSFAIDPASSAVCTLTDGQVSFQAAGSCTINATQAGNSNYNAAPPVQQSFSVLATQVTGNTPGGPVTARITGGCLGFQTGSTQFTVPTRPPAGANFPYGVFGFTALQCGAGGTLTITLTYPQPLPAETRYWKNISGNWVDWTNQVKIAGNTVILTITDGGAGDTNPAAGEISDPSGPAFGGGATSIPTLSEWGLILLGLALLTLAGWRQRQGFTPRG